MQTSPDLPWSQEANSETVRKSTKAATTCTARMLAAVLGSSWHELHRGGWNREGRRAAAVGTLPRDPQNISNVPGTDAGTVAVGGTTAFCDLRQ